MPLLVITIDEQMFANFIDFSKLLDILSISITSSSKASFTAFKYDLRDFYRKIHQAF